MEEIAVVGPDLAENAFFRFTASVLMAAGWFDGRSVVVGC
jgi:hypothetical protein